LKIPKEKLLAILGGNENFSNGQSDREMRARAAGKWVS
jgi:hypothetical protein